MSKTHECGGMVLIGGWSEHPHQYCDGCGAFTHDVEAAELPSGVNVAANRRAWNDGEFRSEDATASV